MMNKHVKLKKYNKSTIQYIIIHSSEKNTAEHLLGVPRTYNILRHLAKYPRDFFQLENPALFFNLSNSVSELNAALNILFLDENSLNQALGKNNSYINLLNLKDRPTVYFIDAESKRLKDVFSFIMNVRHKYFYFSFFNGRGVGIVPSYLAGNGFKDTFDLVRLFKRDFDGFKSMLTNGKDLEMNLDETSNDNLFFDFNPAINNQLTFQQVKSNFWKNSPPKLVALETHSERDGVLLKSMVVLDELHFKDSNALPILITAFPFYNPLLKKYLKKITQLSDQKYIEQFYSLEQDSNYNHILIDYDNSIGNNEQMIGAEILKRFLAPKMLAIDAICHLHSSFTFSPTIRFPLKGKSLYKELSFFNPSSGNFKRKKSSKQKINTILKFGRKLSENTISKEIAKYLKNREGQILAISDLPIEFLTLDGIPLGYSHDVCRIQESNYQGFLNNYSAHNKLEYFVSENTISNILVILSGDAEHQSSHEFSKTYELVISHSKTYGFKYSFCNNIKEIKMSIDRHSPEILIFDCHGEIDKDLETSYLLVGSEKVYNSDIVEHKLGAPIVFLSCCNTNRNFGYNNKIHDAFFEVGALTVTGTFLPISIYRGTACYLRIIYSLKESIEKKMFTNWLNFISQSIRTSVIHDLIIKIGNRINHDYSESEIEKIARVIDDIRDFSIRRKVFKSLLNGGIKISPNLTINIFDTESEFLMYTHYGRPDLIKMKYDTIVNRN
ncbi:hypothetical protein [Algoriphagus pacificus]|uniref:CHAT domain-containing protein n=1 Tax=Algoriphagus pacificus TaxID=2811234 RepID=A0ABS3CLW9_9BACT|nr:hypothetical protein [Algoriphagus pacificus]MBN7818075.1 hypothetical protein [Algoriphagus pacificus]